MSTRYADLTDALADQWITGLRQLQEVQTAAVVQWVRNSAAFFPDADVRLEDQLTEQREIVEANYRLGQRLLDAQRDYLLALVDAAGPAAQATDEAVARTQTAVKKTVAKTAPRS